MRRVTLGVVAALCVAAAPAHADVPVTLRGSPASMVRQNEVAKENGLAFTRSPDEVRELESAGELVPVTGNDDYELADVSYQLAVPEMRIFIERLGAQYRAATGEKLVVTSLTRPASRQPGNSHDLSVHPAGIAVDLRISQRAASREWLESTLLALEERGMLDVTRERYPPHYHVALFPVAYGAHAERLMALEAAERERVEAAAAAAARTLASSGFLAAAAPAQNARTHPVGWFVLALGLVAGWVVTARRTERDGVEG